MSSLTQTLEGYQISRLEHSLQSATRAYNNKENEEILNLDMFRETITNKNKGIDVISGEYFDLSKEINLTPKTALILELE